MPGYRDSGTLVEETGAGILARDDAETLLRASPVHAGGGVIVAKVAGLRGKAGTVVDWCIESVKSGSRRRCRDAILLCRDRGHCWWDESDEHSRAVRWCRDTLGQSQAAKVKI